MGGGGVPPLANNAFLFKHCWWGSRLQSGNLWCVFFTAACYRLLLLVVSKFLPLFGLDWNLALAFVHNEMKTSSSFYYLCSAAHVLLAGMFFWRRSEGFQYSESISSPDDGVLFSPNDIIEPCVIRSCFNWHSQLFSHDILSTGVQKLLSRSSSTFYISTYFVGPLLFSFRHSTN